MSFLLLLCVGAVIARVLGLFFRTRLSLRDCMRYGMGMGFLFTGVDHFLNGAARYVPMMPDALSEHALTWVHASGAAELAGGIGLMVPVAIYRGLGLPDLQRLAGIMLAVLLICVVPANINVALKGQSVQGLDFGSWYYWIRPFFQPVFIAWALYAVGVWPGRRSSQRPIASMPRLPPFSTIAGRRRQTRARRRMSG